MYCELNESREMYDETRDELRKAFIRGKVNYNDALAKLQKLSQIAGGFYSEVDDYGERHITQIGTEKLNLLKGVVTDFPDDKKFVIFCRYLSEISAIAIINSLKLQSFL
jgi:hypothetical protein